MSRNVPTIEHTLGGVVYTFRPPKTIIILSAYMRIHGLPKSEAGPILVKAQMKWLSRGFGSTQWAAIEDRLEDEDDVLDFHHLMESFQQLVSTDAGRPTTSLPESSEDSPAATSSAEKRSPQDSMFSL